MQKQNIIKIGKIIFKLVLLLLLILIITLVVELNSFFIQTDKQLTPEEKQATQHLMEKYIKSKNINSK